MKRNNAFFNKLGRYHRRADKNNNHNSGVISGSIQVTISNGSDCNHNEIKTSKKIPKVTFDA
jgi:hypothetical protein